jgi:2-polyprenyl-3-methyl-5-hydroxy-6-metoxy-1,4-benzoquinol methylase
MKYNKSYAVLTSITSFLGRKVFCFRKAETEYIIELLKQINSETILDFGCNDGHITREIQKHFPNTKIFGTDISKDALEIAKRKSKNINFFHLDDEFMKNNKFDAIVFTHVLEHTKDRVQALKNIHNLLNENGKLIVAVPQERIRGDMNVFQVILNIFTLKFENPHVVKIDLKMLTELFNETNFELSENIKYFNLFRPWVTNSRKLHSWSLVAMATKK